MKKPMKTMLETLPYTAISRYVASIVVMLLLHASLLPAFAASLPVDVMPSANAEVPPLRFARPDGSELRLKDQQSKIIVLHFWATWCAPCIEELPKLAEFVDKNRRLGVTFLPVSLDGKKNHAKVTKFYEDHHIKSLPILFGNQVEIMKSISLKGLPTTLFIVDGKEAGRANTDVDWQDADIVTYLEQLTLGK